MYSNPPAHGARVVANVLADEKLFNQWREHIKLMSSRVIEMREALRAELINYLILNIVLYIYHCRRDSRVQFCNDIFDDNIFINYRYKIYSVFFFFKNKCNYYFVEIIYYNYI
ncbi:unnamed protein product [Leptidea sinapis]|nr:unnamed protein product [Leptidea sinapis]